VGVKSAPPIDDGSAAPASRTCVGCGREAAIGACGFCGVAAAPGGFLVERVVKQGPHGRVYRARDGEGRAVALKELQFAAVPGTQQIDAFQREAGVLKELRHPAIPRFVGGFEEGEGAFLRLYLASEFIEGESLAARIAARGKLGEAELHDVLSQALTVLDYLHGLAQPVLHRDIKPDNIIIRPSGELVLVDFGSARRLEGSRTHGATLAGTFGYMPIEQLGGTVDATSDLYALGATLLHAATGNPPDELIDHGDFRLRVPENLPPRLRHVIEGMVQPRRARRFPGVAAVRAALASGPRPRHRVGRSIALGIALGVPLVAGALALRPPQAAPQVPATRPARPDTPAQWFQKAKPSCNSFEVARLMAYLPPPAGTEGTGYAATCQALAGKIDQARRLILTLPSEERHRAAGLLFPYADAVADAGDDVTAAPLMKLILEFWPNHVQAMYHAGISEYALGRPEAARPLLDEFLRLYQTEDGFRQRAKSVVDRIAKGLPAQ